ncbi:ABC transporter permease [Clostridium estertheticum]|uniref:ABC transporter permease n=1 Tax=Clostridium estertheticum TaxID=238834 RepID=A0AA47EKA3_9CLOT|nr:ABC transporter permease [Clostridium estertheticum]MBU3156080.1 ABC transporter permease [Clostridium estertheticum]MBU3199612.1 ABC transporter permease [Clostridium estertheticum]WAG60591.1 ABC transporter permease [Clostridium estertheticum]WAG65318.1 ABC transporter permease [Clostridium estertheticum]
MAKYIIKRIGYMIITLWVVATITFVLINAIPGDPITASAGKVLDKKVAAEIMKKYQLDQPEYVRYGTYIKNLVHGDLGMSIHYPGQKVNDIISKEFPVSLRLALQAVGIGLVFGIFLGIIAAFKRNTWVDYTVIFIALIGVCVPGFVLAILLQYGLGAKFGLKIAGWSSSSLFNIYRYSLLPSIALAMAGLASNARFMRTSVLEVINQDYVLTAKSKGVGKVSLVWKHIIRNAILPVVTMIGPRIAYVITGSLVVESIFSVPGLGRELVSAISNRDYTVVMSLTVFFAFLYIVSLLIVDIVYVLVDPRIKLTQRKG